MKRLFLSPPAWVKDVFCRRPRRWHVAARLFAPVLAATPDYAIDRQSALLIEKENPAQLAERILELINHDSLRQQIAENGNHLIRHEFSWQSSVSRLEECFSKALEK
ncbi:MAG: glycosyltransferase [Ferruginibacter sp.]